MATREHPVILYDGVCALCDRSCQEILDRDRYGVFHFAALQSAFAREVLLRHGEDPDTVDQMYVLIPGDPERLVGKGRAAIAVLERLPGKHRTWARVLRRVPRPILDRGYDLVARNRYRLFGKYDACRMPDPAWADRFVDQPAST